MYILMRLLGFLSVKLLVGCAASGMEVQTNDAEAGSLATPAPEDELGDADAEPGETAGAFKMMWCVSHVCLHC